MLFLTTSYVKVGLSVKTLVKGRIVILTSIPLKFISSVAKICNIVTRKFNLRNSSSVLNDNS
jgi:hypothetical protein